MRTCDGMRSRFVCGMERAVAAPLDVAFYLASARDARGRGIMGWQVASETFLDACIAHMPTDDFHAHAAEEADARAFAAKVRTLRPDANVRWTPFTGFASLARADVRRLGRKAFRCAG
jgi:ornithine cyclodeaminase/alanine dehydrogenase-like protein (mu-crystallin family)